MMYWWWLMTVKLLLFLRIPPTTASDPEILPASPEDFTIPPLPPPDDIDPLYEAWQAFHDLQQHQADEFNREFPIDERLYSSFRKCGNFDLPGERLSDNVQPSNFEIYAELGHLNTFCRIDLTLSLLSHLPTTTVDFQAALESYKRNCLESAQTKSKNPTLSKILTAMGANLQVFESNVVHNNLHAWARHIVRMIERVPGYESKWKMIMIAPGLFDIDFGTPTYKLAESVMQAVQLINHKLPEKTIVVVIRNSKLTFWKHLVNNFDFCKQIHKVWPTHEAKSERLWNMLEERLKKNFRSETFYTHVLNLLEESRPLKVGNTLDISVMSSDCVHFSSRGISLLHTHLWNWLVQPSRQVEWTPLVRPLYCPRPSCPFLVTKTNTYFCPQAKQTDPEEKFKDLSDVMIVTMLLVTVLLYALLLAFIGCGVKRKAPSEIYEHISRRYS
uniref:SGNH domain-containing protein n=1 Tax=Panagrellus redivivus TaxID=6233 RepID=A0A7E4ZRM0_PANRE